jgi:hypothetical protein
VQESCPAATSPTAASTPSGWCTTAASIIGRRLSTSDAAGEWHLPGSVTQLGPSQLAAAAPQRPSDTSGSTRPGAVTLCTQETA